MKSTKQIREIIDFVIAIVDPVKADGERIGRILEYRLSDLYLSGVAHGQNTLLKLDGKKKKYV